MTYKLGTAARMGPGFFPFFLGAILMVFSLEFAVTRTRDSARRLFFASILYLPALWSRCWCGIIGLVLIRRQVVERIGMLDERFFYYWEETDWCLRAGENGWKILHVPPAKIWHKGVQRDYRPSPNVTYYATRNHLLLLQKHRAPFSVWLFTILQTLRTLVSWTIRPRWREMHGHRDAMWQGMLDYFGRRWGMRPVRLPQ